MTDEKYMVFNVGCIECGVSSKIVGIFSDKVMAENVAKECQEKFSWRDGGQNHFEVHVLPAQENALDAEYMQEQNKDEDEE